MHIQFGHSFTFGLEQGTFVLVGLSIQATDGALPGDVGAVWGAHTAWLVLLVHLTLLSGTTVDILARLFAGDAMWRPSIEDHPFEEGTVGYIFLRPRGAQPPSLAALILGQIRPVEDLAAAVLGLLKPAVPSVHDVIFHVMTEAEGEEDKQARADSLI